MPRTERGDLAAHIEQLHLLLVDNPTPQDVLAVREFAIETEPVLFAATLSDPKLMAWIMKHRQAILAATDAHPLL